VDAKIGPAVEVTVYGGIIDNGTKKREAEGENGVIPNDRYQKDK